MAIVRAMAMDDAPGGEGHRGDEALKVRCPLLHEYLTASCFDDAVVRKGATVMIFSASDGWKMLLNERDQELNLWVTADSPDSLWDAMEGALAAEQVAWRRAKGWKPPVPRPVGRAVLPKKGKISK